ncbi:hypothetical protein GCM10009616_33530 [Microlunatus lacustris]
MTPPTQVLTSFLLAIAFQPASADLELHQERIYLGMLGVGLALVGTVLLVFDVVVGQPTALVVAALMAVVIAGIAALPALLDREPASGSGLRGRRRRG